MKRFLLSLLTVALCGSVFRMLLPRGGSEKILRFILALAVLLAGVSLLVNSGWLSLSVELPEFTRSESEEEFRLLVEEQAREALEEQVARKVQELSGRAPESVSAELSYEEDVFVPGRITVLVRGCDEDALREQLCLFFGYEDIRVHSFE